MARKTFNVADFVTMVNGMVAYSTEHLGEYGLPDPRPGLIAALESVLIETDNYRGFTYLPSEFDQFGVLRETCDTWARRYYV